jgi:hypothetical protein
MKAFFAAAKNAAKSPHVWVATLTAFVYGMTQEMGIDVDQAKLDAGVLLVMGLVFGDWARGIREKKKSETTAEE